MPQQRIQHVLFPLMSCHPRPELAENRVIEAFVVDARPRAYGQDNGRDRLGSALGLASTTKASITRFSASSGLG